MGDPNGSVVTEHASAGLADVRKHTNQTRKPNASADPHRIHPTSACPKARPASKRALTTIMAANPNRLEPTTRPRARCWALDKAKGLRSETVATRPITAPNTDPATAPSSANPGSDKTPRAERATPSAELCTTAPTAPSANAVTTTAERALAPTRVPHQTHALRIERVGERDITGLSARVSSELYTAATQRHVLSDDLAVVRGAYVEPAFKTGRLLTGSRSVLPGPLVIS
jgi:hypothetical protein